MRPAWLAYSVCLPWLQEWANSVDMTDGMFGCSASLQVRWCGSGSPESDEADVTINTAESNNGDQIVVFGLRD